MIPFRNLSVLQNMFTKSMRKYFRKSSHLRSQKLQNTQAHLSIKIRQLPLNRTKEAWPLSNKEQLKTDRVSSDVPWLKWVTQRQRQQKQHHIMKNMF